MSTRYEWCVETVEDEDNDVLNLDHRDKFEQVKWALTAQADEGHHYDICLIRNKFDEYGDLIDQQWAYLEDGKLPTHFDVGAKVPKKFHKEVAP